MADTNSRLRSLRDEADDLLNAFYYRMLKLKEGRPEQGSLDLLRRARAALETHSYKDAVLQFSSFSRVARDAINLSEDSAQSFKTVEKSLDRLRLFAEKGIEVRP